MSVLTLFTNRFQAYQPPQGVPVRITLGAPRFKLPYSLTHSVRELAPRRDYLSEPEPEFTTAYRADLNRLGAARIAARLRQIAEAENDHRLVLLCFEDLSAPSSGVTGGSSPPGGRRPPAMPCANCPRGGPI